MDDRELRELILSLLALIERLFPFILVVLALLLIGSMVTGRDLAEPVAITAFILAAVFVLRWLGRRYIP